MGNSLPNNVEQPKSFKVHHPYFHILIGYFIKIHDLAKHHFHFGNTVIYQHLNTKEIKIRIFQDLSAMTEAELRWQSGIRHYILNIHYHNLLFIIIQSWILILHKDRILRKKHLEMWVWNIQAEGYNGAHMVHEIVIIGLPLEKKL